MTTTQHTFLVTPADLNDRYDVVVMGSGAAGRTAAVRVAHAGVRVVVVDKDTKLGGTSAAGGGVIWSSANHLGVGAGYEDSNQAGIEYLSAAAGDKMRGDDIAWYVRTSGEGVKFLDHHTRVELLPLARPDYHIEWPGAAAGGRSHGNAALRTADYPEIAHAQRQRTHFQLLSML